MEIVENLIVSSGFLFLTNYTPFSHHTRFCYQTSAFAKNNCRLHLHLPPPPRSILGHQELSSPATRPGAPLLLCPAPRPWTANTWSATQLHILQAKTSFSWPEQYIFFCKQRDAQCSNSISALFRAIIFLPHSTAHVTRYLTLDVLLYKKHFKIIGKSHQRDYFCLLN